MSNSDSSNHNVTAPAATVNRTSASSITGDIPSVDNAGSDSSVKKIAKMEGNGVDKDEVRLRRDQIKSYDSRPRTLSAMSKKSSTISDDQPPLRMTDYLEKRSKVLGWKRYWFVLDGHLLTYYKSKDDYDKISPFSGSINLGIATTVRPIQIKGCKGFPLQIVTRSQVYYLRSLDKPTLEKWLLALQETTSTPPTISSPFWADPGVQFYRYSFAALSQWSLQDAPDDITGSLSNLPKNFYLNRGDRDREPGSLKKKCHSFASLQHPSVFPGTSKPVSSKGCQYNYNSAGYYAGSPSSSPTRTYREMSEKSTSKVRQATSMLVLESSPQAMELRQELAKKLSVGTPSSKSSDRSPQQVTKSENEAIVTGSVSMSDSDENLHHYDEIIDFEALYESCGDGDNSGPIIQDDDSSSGIYESVDSGSASSDPWEKLKLDQTDTPKRHSNRNSLLTIPEIPEQQNVFNKRKNNLTPIAEDKKSAASLAPVSSESSQDSLSHVLPDAGGGGKSVKKKKGIAGIFQKIFKKDDKSMKRQKDKEMLKRGSTMVITGPVDLKSQLQKTNSAPKMENSRSESNNSANNTRAVELKKSSPPPGSQSVFSDDSVLNELKSKVGQLKRANSEVTPTGIVGQIATSADNINCGDNKQILARRSTIQITSTPISPERKPGADKERTLADIKAKQVLPMTLLFQSSITEYQQKLAKFNRLSAHLNPSFVAVFKPNPVPIVLGQIGRSSSCKIKSVEEPPMLPPKKKTPPIANAYDYPCNNSPVRSKSEAVHVIDNVGKPPPTIRELAKKNSAPDIMFPSSALSTSREILPHILNQRFDIADSQVQIGSCVPPRPVKKNTVWNHCTYSEDFVNVSDSSPGFQQGKQKSESQVVPPIPPHCQNASKNSFAIQPCTSCGLESHVSLPLDSTTTPTHDLATPEIKGSQELKNSDHVVSQPQLSHESTNADKPPTTATAETLIQRQLVNQSVISTELVRSATPPMKDIKVHIASATPPVKPKRIGWEPFNSGAEKPIPVMETLENCEIQTKEPLEIENSNALSNTNDTSDQQIPALPSVAESLDVSAPIFKENNSEILETNPPPSLVDPMLILMPSQERCESQDLVPSIQVVQNETKESEDCKTEAVVDNSSPELENVQPTQNPNTAIIAHSHPPDVFTFLPNGTDTTKITLTPDSVSPTLSSKSVDIDNLDILSELSDDSLPVSPTGVIKPTNGNETKNSVLEETCKAPLISLQNKSEDDFKMQRVYENVKYATINKLVTEFEVVEETEDEMQELYDDFPSEYIAPILPLQATFTLEDPIQPNDNKAKEKSRVESIRHSGFDELQKYLGVETHLTSISPNNAGQVISSDLPARIPTSGGALSKLGHSPAVDKLQRILQNN